MRLPMNTSLDSIEDHSIYRGRSELINTSVISNFRGDEEYRGTHLHRLLYSH